MRVVRELFSKLAVFMMAYFFIIYTFAISFLLLSRGKVSESKEPYFSDDYFGYMLIPFYDIWSSATGDFNWHQDGLKDDPNKYSSMVLWILMVFLLHIIMLNLLVGIVTGAYEQIEKTRTPCFYMERAKFLSENGHVVSKETRRSANKSDGQDFCVVVRSGENE